MTDHMSYPGHNEHEPTEQERAEIAVNQALQNLNAKKRKRDTSDLDTKLSSSKRASLSNNANGNSHDISLYSDPMRDQSTGSHDFSQLSQQLVRHVAGANHGLPDAAHASSTAAAALAGIMPQLTVPQPTELSFASSGSGTDGDRQLDSSFDMDTGQNHHNQGPPYNLGVFHGGGTAAQVQAAREASNGGGGKPPVGSEEWHKVRRDNHKEGRYYLDFFDPMALMLVLS